MINKKHENGVALLFALGLLSLMSVLGVAFVTNSLIAQKTAVNLGSRNQAQILLDSAVNRVMVTLMALLRQDQSTTDFSVIYSTNDGTERTTALDDESKFNTHDQLSDATTSKLNMYIPGLPKYDGSKSKSTWVYIRDDDGKIVGRMAYQVLPTGTSSLSLDRVLKGIYNPLNKALVEGAKDNNAWNQRVGRGIDELYIGETAAFRQAWSVDNDAGQILPANSSVPIVSSFNEFFNTDIYKIIGDETPADAERRVWLRRWFSESTHASPEVFYFTESPDTKMGEATAYHRFNVGPIDGVTNEKWYRRINGFVKAEDSFNETIRNSDHAVKQILAPSLKFYPEDVNTPAGSGIPYLRKIAKTAGSFSNLEIRRKQIAANLNDYCDEDNIPTSDKEASTWSDSVVPTYTGNEKTPYINEFLLGFKMTPTLTGIEGNFKVSIKSDFLTELIDIYSVTGASSTAKYNLKAWLTRSSLELKVVSASGTVTYSDGTTEAFSDVSCTKNGGITDDLTDSVTVDFNGNQFSSGYCVVSKELGNIPDITFNMKEAIESKLSKKGENSITKVVYDSLTLQVSDIKYNLSAAVLFDQTDAVYGIDFVKGPADKIASTGVKEITLKTSAVGTALEPVISSGKVKSNAWQYFYLTGTEVRDPRQNLNFTKATTLNSDFVAAASDWKAIPVIEHNFEKNNGDPDEFSVGTIKINYDNPATLVLAGVVNSCSNPSAPFSDADKYTASGSVGDWEENYDKETVTEPIGMSTAFIRNAPMQSLWELGAIHRGSAWETINIKGAAKTEGATTKRIELSDNNSPAEEKLSDPGIAYIDGDAVILDQVKLTSGAYSSGKLDVNMLHEVVPATPAPGYTLSWNDDMCKALLANVRYGQKLSDLGSLPDSPVAVGGTQISWAKAADAVTYLKTKPLGRTGKNADKYVSRADFVQGHQNPQGTVTHTLANGYGIITNHLSLPDAQQEELVGKTVNLLTAGATAPTTIQAVVVVQTIKGIKVDSGNTVTVIRPVLKKNGTAETVSIAKSSNDLVIKKDSEGRYVYSDEITSELRALVTITKVQDASGIRLQLNNIQYY